MVGSKDRESEERHNTIHIHEELSNVLLYFDTC